MNRISDAIGASLFYIGHLSLVDQDIIHNHISIDIIIWISILPAYYIGSIGHGYVSLFIHMCDDLSPSHATHRSSLTTVDDWISGMNNIALLCVDMIIHQRPYVGVR